jgi:amino-acid N-acetyltransferase
VNLGSFYGTRAAQDSPKFVQRSTEIKDSLAISGSLNIALVKIRAPQHLNDSTLAGVARTLSQLAKLGLTSTVVVDCEDSKSGPDDPADADLRALANEQADRIVAAIDACGLPGARRVENIIGVAEKETDAFASAASVRGRTHVKFRKLLMTPLRRGIIPVIPAIGYADETQRATIVMGDDAVLALTREFAGLKSVATPDEDPKTIAEKLRSLRNEVSLDRLIILDPLGGIPTPERPEGYHIFLNLEQEFDAVKKSLLKTPADTHISQHQPDSSATQVSDIARGNPFSRFVETEIVSPFPPGIFPEPSRASGDKSPTNTIHLQNLELVRRALSLLPPTSSALLTTPIEAANSEKQSASFQAIGVGTRRQRNPLIHNLLTDKPVYSSSLPAGRLGKATTSGTYNKSMLAHIPPTTFVKRGMPLTIFPDPRGRPWLPCLPGQTRLSLTDSHMDLPRLVHLIDDSFNRQLDVQAYLKRVNDRIAGVIIAGEYEGGALLTWEMPPGVPDDGSEETKARMVPYLDKFAVLKRSQGAGGVADILFKAMVKDCFPNGVCWRSRRDNPVNKWYFERSRGTWKIPDTNWTMFWTTPDLDFDRQRFSDYEGVCGRVVPSWADNKNVVD